MPEPEPELEQLAEFADSLITIYYDRVNGRVLYDLGELDPWAAYTMLQQAADDVYSELPEPVSARNPMEDE